MDGQPTRQWGLTTAISTALPTEKELELNGQLIDELKRQNNFESQEATDRRYDRSPYLRLVFTDSL